MIKKHLVLIITILLFGLFFIPTANTIELQYHKEIQKNFYQILKNDYINITVQEAFNYLNNTSNGIQIPIDVRTDFEWVSEHIDIPFPENPIHYVLTNLQDPTKLQEFMIKYDGKELIIHCKSGSRSITACEILVNNGFNGTIMNMIGGITSWANAGYAVVPNRKPEIPEISGPFEGNPGKNYIFTYFSNDLDYDKLEYYIDWGDGDFMNWHGFFDSGEEVIINHSWIKKGDYQIKIKSRDPYDNESDWGTLNITLPRTRSIDNPIQKLFENPQLLFKILHLLKFKFYTNKY